ncbi:MAG TPA: hypothetical protein VNO54_08200, partial [Streptosporangiaceae bacterium]|nr:hypothetical protein [Streptosporangiaceae bacterium]
AFQHNRAGATLARAARTFVDAYGARRAGDDEYTSLLRDGFENFGNLTDVGDPADFQRLRAGLEEAIADRDVATMQGAHRRLLAHLHAVADACAPWLVTRSAVRSAPRSRTPHLHLGR